MNHDESADDLPPASAQSGTLELLVLPLFRYKRTVLAATIAGFLAATFYAVLQPNFYISSGKVHYIPSVSETSAPTSLETEGQPRISTEGLQNEIQILNSVPLFERVAKVIRPEVVLDVYDPYASDGPDTSWPVRMLHDFQAWWFQEEQVSSAAEVNPEAATPAESGDQLQLAVDELMASTTIEPIDYAWVLRISYQSHDRLLAQRIASQLLTESVNRHSEVFFSNAAVEFLTTRLTQVVTERINAEDKLKGFQKECGFTNMTLQQDLLLNAQSTAAKEVSELEASIGKEEAELKVLREQLTQLPEKVEQVTPSVAVTNPDYTKLAEKLESKKEARNSFVKNYGENTEGVPAMDAEIAELTEKLSNTPSEKLQPAQVSLVVNPDWDQIADNIRTAEKTLAGLRETLNEKRVFVASVENEIDRSTECEFQLKALDNEVDRLQKFEQKLQVELENQEQAHAIQQANISNLILLEHASFPSEKSGPKREKIVFLGVFAGFALGAMLALAHRTLSPKLQEPEEMERICPAKVVLILPVKRQLKK